MRKEVPEIGWGDFEVVDDRNPGVLALRYDWRNNSVRHRFTTCSARRSRSSCTR